jgi:hypothetical protein
MWGAAPLDESIVVDLGLGCIVTLYHRSSTAYHIR